MWVAFHTGIPVNGVILTIQLRPVPITITGCAGVGGAAVVARRAVKAVRVAGILRTARALS